MLRVGELGKTLQIDRRPHGDVLVVDRLPVDVTIGAAHVLHAQKKAERHDGRSRTGAGTSASCRVYARRPAPARAGIPRQVRPCRRTSPGHSANRDPFPPPGNKPSVPALRHRSSAPRNSAPTTSQSVLSALSSSIIFFSIPLSALRARERITRTWASSQATMPAISRVG